MITKKALNQNYFRREWIYTDSARDAWSEILETYKVLNPDGKVLLPSYIGWSANEGSGIFDSVIKSGLAYDFYELSLHLEINFSDLKQKTLNDKSQLVLLVHYFGFVDANYKTIAKWLLENNIFFVEDAAHAWLSDLIGGVCGRESNYSFYSLHKLLPMSKGGIMVNNNPGEKHNDRQINPFFELNYDLFAIYKVRRSNYQYLCTLLEDLPGIHVIHKTLDDGICPQTLPVLVEHYDRDRLYHEMNGLGFGMVSLYHTMIKALEACPYESASVLSKKIINFPIHQDINNEQINEMVKQIKKILDA